MSVHPLLAMVLSKGNPVIEGNVATFLWQGMTAPYLIDDVHNWDESPQKLSRIGTKLWSLSIPLPSDAYLEYTFLDPKTGLRLPDPLNPRKVWNGISDYNHFFYMPKGTPTKLVHGHERIPQGTVTKHAVPSHDYVVGSKRIVYLYQPAVDNPVPLLFVYDGSDYIRRARLNVIVDNLIAQKRVRPFAMAMVKNGGKARTVEYSCSEATLGFLMECVLPLAKEHMSLESITNGGFGIMGASLGGSMALFTALRLPQVFTKVLTQSGAFITPDYQSGLVDLVRYAPPPGIDIWMDAGSFEWLLDGNRQMYNLLKEKKYQVTYHEYSGGHNYTAWRNDLWRGLESLYRK